MFGQNPIRKIDHAPVDGKLAVQEVFMTIQGEGPYTGCAALFIRLAGCHLACTFCDTEFESGINNRLPITEIVADALREAGAQWPPQLPLPMVVLTGGEPLRQSVGVLCDHLIAAGFKHVQIETAGNLWDETLCHVLESGSVSLVVSPKTPKLHPMIVRYCSHYKYVVRQGDAHPLDGLPVMPTQAHQRNFLRLARPWDFTETSPAPITVWVSPCDEHDTFKNEDNVKHAVGLVKLYGYRLSLQTHKYINLP